MVRPVSAVTEPVYTLANEAGMRLRFIAPGGIILSLDVPDRAKTFTNVTPAYDDLRWYEQDPNYFGAIVGRCANGIANAPAFPSPIVRPGARYFAQTACRFSAST